jgi:hypothetical protein
LSRKTMVTTYQTTRQPEFVSVFRSIHMITQLEILYITASLSETTHRISKKFGVRDLEQILYSMFQFVPISVH